MPTLSEYVKRESMADLLRQRKELNKRIRNRRKMDKCVYALEQQNRHICELYGIETKDRQ